MLNLEEALTLRDGPRPSSNVYHIWRRYILKGVTIKCRRRYYVGRGAKLVEGATTFKEAAILREKTPIFRGRPIKKESV